MKYKYTIAVAAFAALTLTSHAQICQYPDPALDPYQTSRNLERQIERINDQLKEERDNRFSEALRHGDIQGMIDN